MQVFHQIGEGSKWTNVYHVDADDLTSVIAAFGDNMLDPLLSNLHPSARIVKVLVSSLTDDTFVENGYEAFGTSSFTDSRLPVFNCVKAQFNTAGLGRPDVKYYKGWATEENSDSEFFDPTALSAFAVNITDFIGDMSSNTTPLVSENGDLWLSVTCKPAVQMRQMHRKRKKTPPAP